MNLTPIIPLLKLLKDAGGEVSPPGPPAPDDTENGAWYRTDGRLTYAGYRKFVDPAASGNDYQDYLLE